MQLLLNASILEKIFEADPKIKVDILNTAIPQLANYIAKKWTADAVAKKIDDAIKANLSAVQYGNLTMSQKDGFKKIILDIWKSEMKDRLEIDARRIAEEIAGQKVAEMLDTVRSEISQARDTAQAEIDAYARSAAEREVLALLRGGNLVINKQD